jgi:hypothetical protein
MILDGKVLNIRVIELIKIYTLYYDDFCICRFWTVQIWISKMYKEKLIFETLDGFKLVLFFV